MTDINELVLNLSHLMRHRMNLDDEAFAALMEKILLPFPEIQWERGPAFDDDAVDQLSISTGELYDDHQFSNFFPIREDDWRIDVGIPPKHWDMYFEMNLSGELIAIEGRRWYWRADFHSTESTLIHVAIPHEEASALTEGGYRDAVEILIIGEIGEVNLRKYLQVISIKRLPKIDKDRWSPLPTLKKWFANRYPSARFVESFQT